MSFARDGSRLIVGGDKSSITLWDPSISRLLKTLNLPSETLFGITYDGRLVAGTRDGDLDVYEMRTLKQVSRFETEIAFTSLSVFDNSVFNGSKDGVIQ